MSMRN